MKAKVLIIALLLISSVSFAQRKMDPEMMEQIKTKKIAFITEKVGLTSKEAEKFWPVYNQWEKDRYDLMEKKRSVLDCLDSKTPPKSEPEYKKLANEFTAIHVREGKLMEEYNIKLLSILSAEKVVKLYAAEGKFRSYLMHEYRKEQDNKGGK